MRTITKVAIAAGALAICTAGGFGVGVAAGDQPHMQSALGYLNSAKGELSVALHNKGGHRVNALRLVNQAITETQAGIAAGDGD
ncbi:MAG TPA: hypothetical protein VGI95_16985 [Caulobacteraceae bacterium]